MKKRVLAMLLALVMVVSLFPVTTSMASTPDPVDNIEAYRNVIDEEIYFLTRSDSSLLKIGDEIAWLDESYTEDSFISIGVPDNSGVVRIVEKSDWEAYYPAEVDFYLDVIKSGKGFDGCIHGTLNHNVTEYNCWYGGVQHLKGKAYTFVSKPFYSKVTFKLDVNGAPSAGHKVELYDGEEFFLLTDKGNGVYSSSKVYVGQYSIYVDGKPANLGVNVEKTPYSDGYFCTIDNDGNYVEQEDRTIATAYYSGHEYEVYGYFFDYDISIYYNGSLSDELGKLSFYNSGKVYGLTKTGVGRYVGTIIVSTPLESSSVDLCLGNNKTGTYFQTKRNSNEEYMNNSIKLEYYDGTATLKLDDEAFPGMLVGFDNGNEQYFAETDENGCVSLRTKLIREDTIELPYIVTVYGVTDNLPTPTLLSFDNRNVELDFFSVSFITDDATKPYRTQYVRSGSAPNRVGTAVIDGLSFSCWSLAPWDKEEDISTVEKFDFTSGVMSPCKVYAHATMPTVDIYDTYVGTDLSGNIVTDGSATAFRMPSVTIAGFSNESSSIKSFCLEPTNVDKVYFYNTSDVIITTGDGVEPENGNGGYFSASDKITVSFNEMVSMVEAQEYIRNNVVIVPTAGNTAEIKLTVSDEVISVEDKSIIDQSKYSDTNWKKLSTVSGNILNSGFYYVDTNITKNASSVNTNGLVINGTVYLYIPEGKTLTATGYAGYFKEGSGSTVNDVIYPGTAGILLLEGNSLYVYGKGTLKAQGGNAGDGSNGYDATTSVSTSDLEYVSSGTGFGGRGGSGAGAGIGTNGAVLDPNVDMRLSKSNFSMDLVTRGGEVGYDGPDSKAVTDNMGALYIAETVTVDAQGGAAGKNGTAGGKAGENKVDVSYKGGKISVGAGGGGGAGYGGHAGADIGRGGATGASGGSGGAGGLTQGSKSGNAGGGGKGAVNGAGTQSGTGGAGGKAGADNNPKVGESVTPGVTSVSDGHEFNYTVTFDGSGQTAIPYFMEERTITVPDYAGTLEPNEQFIGWKVKTYGNTFGTASASNPLTTAENILYVPGSTITINRSTYGNLVLAPIITAVPGNSANDLLSLTSLNSSKLNKYTLELKCNGDLTDLGTVVFTDNNGNKYNVNSAMGDDTGKYVLTLSKDVTIVKIELNGVTLLGDDFTTPITLSKDECKTANVKSMEIAVSGRDVTQVTVNGTYQPEYNENYSEEGTSVFVAFAQTDDTSLYNISVDGETIPATVAQAQFGTRAEILYSTVNVSVMTNISEPLSLRLIANDGTAVSLYKSGAKYSATSISTGDKEYTLYINESDSNQKVKLNQITIDADAEYYIITLVSNVDGLQKATNHTLAVNGVNAITYDNTTFTAIALSTDPCTVLSNDVEVASVTPSSTLGTTYVDYYSVTYQLGAHCTGTVPVDATLYLKDQTVTVLGTDGLTTDASNTYVAGWSFNSDDYCEGDTVQISGPIVFTPCIIE